MECKTSRVLRFQPLAATLVITPLVWGIYADSAASLKAPADWKTLQQAALGGSWSALGGNPAWGYVKPAFALPCKNTAGFGALLSAAASFHQTANLTTSTLNDPAFQNWLEPVVDALPNFA